MAKVKFKVSSEDHEKANAGGDFVLPKPGYYTAVLKECNHGYSKDENGGEDRKRPRLECIYEITGVGVEDAPRTENYGNLWDYVSFSAASGGKRSEFLKAVKLIPEDATEDTEVEIDTDEIVGTKVLVRVRHEKGRNPGDEPRARVQRVKPWLDADNEAAFGGGGSSEPAVDFGGDDEEDDTEEGYTEEELLELSTKELGAVAKEFEIDPTSFVSGKGKKKTVDTEGLIAAILEAQDGEADEDDEDDDDDESPF